jgi:hypothetical protein
MKRSASHLDAFDEPTSKKQATGGTSPAVELPDARSDSLSQHPHPGSTHGTLTPQGGWAQVSALPAPASASHKRSAQEDDDITPPAKRHNPWPKRSSIVWKTTPSTGKEQPVSALSDPVTASRMTASSVSDLFRTPSYTVKDAPRFGQPAGPRHDSTSRSSRPSRANGRNNRHTNTTDPENQGPQKLPASRQPAASGKAPAAEPFQSPEVDCIACGETVPRTKSHSNSCGHAYCSDCINRLLRKAIRDDTLWPPQCCKAEMPIKDIRHLLWNKLIPLVMARQVEMSVPVPNRTYCVSCSDFIPLERIHEKSAVCYTCWDSKCSDCKKLAHVGDCQNKLEQDIKDLEILAEKKGWKKCSTCMMLVEHHIGCFHMTWVFADAYGTKDANILVDVVARMNFATSV